MRWYAGYPSDWNGHVALVHDNEQQRRAGVAAWVRNSLDLGAKVLYIEPPHDADERTLLGILDTYDVPAAGAVARGQLEVFEASPTSYDPSWQDARTDEALAAGYSTVRWSGAADTAWGVMTPAEHIDVEWATDQMCRDKSISVLCQYPTSLPRATLETVCAQHGGGIREAHLRVKPADRGVALAGSVDITNQRTLRNALTAAAATRAREDTLHVDLSSLEFLDVSGARAFLTGTVTYRINGGTVLLDGPCGVVESVLRLLRVDAVAGLRVVAPS